MESGGLLHALRKHWLVLGLTLAFTIAATIGVALHAPRKYQSMVEMTMLNGPKINKQQAFFGNPFLSFNTTLDMDVDLLTRNLLAPDSIQQLAKLGVTEQLGAMFALNAMGPFMELTVTGPNPAHVTQSMNTFIHFAEQRWLQMQRAVNAPAGSIITLKLIAPAGPPTSQHKGLLELVGGVAILGLVMSLLLPSLAEARSRRRASENVGRAGTPQRERKRIGIGPATFRETASAERGRRRMDQIGDTYEFSSRPSDGRGHRSADDSRPADDSRTYVRVGRREK